MIYKSGTFESCFLASSLYTLYSQLAMEMDGTTSLLFYTQIEGLRHYRARQSWYYACIYLPTTTSLESLSAPHLIAHAAL